MLLNSKQIIDHFIIDKENLGKSAQVGYDLTLKHANKIIGGEITKEKSDIKFYDKVRKVGNIFIFDIGVYSLTFHQGIRLPNDKTGEVRSRSSLLRCGAFIGNSIFDPGFECDEIGATLFVMNNNIKIGIKARIAQFIIHENHWTEKYDGQYQQDKDLK